MTISINDLHIYESEVMSNAQNGGGNMTNNAVIDGASNNIFDDVSEPDRAYGKVNQRKLFMAVKSANDDKLFSALTYISKLPLDEKIGVNLVKSSDYFDRVNARTIETRNSIIVSNHDAQTIPAELAPVVTYQSIKYYRDYYYPKFKLLNDVNKSFYTSVSSTSGNTATVTGFDGLYTPTANGTNQNNYIYGLTGLTNFFLGNNFLINNVDCTVTHVDAVSYLETDQSDIINDSNGEINFAYYLTASKGEHSISKLDYPSVTDYYTAVAAFFSNTNIAVISATEILGATSTFIEYVSIAAVKYTTGTIPAGNTALPNRNQVISYPAKKFTLTLTLDKTVGTSSAASLKPINRSAVEMPAYTTNYAQTVKKLFTAKKITSAITANSSTVTVADNDNNIIPSVDGIVLSDTILGVNTAEFASGYVDDEVFGIFRANETVFLPKQNLLSVKVESVIAGSTQILTNYTADLLVGTVTFDNTIPTLSSLKLRITYRVSQPRKAFLVGDIVAILNDKETTGTYTTGQTVTLSRQNLAKISVRDSAKNLVLESKFTTDLVAGTVTFTNVSGLSQPLTIIDRLEDFGLVKSITGNVLTLHKPVVNAYPIENTVVANCLMHGDLQATASGLFDQQTWTNVWQDTLIGSSTSAQFNQTDYPIVVSNNSAVTERWALIFKTSSTFDVVGEHLGVIATNQSVSVNLAPLNPHTSQPYFTIAAAGFGGGWSAGNVIRFNTYSASAPFWVVQTIAQGTATNPDFNFAIEVRGDIDAA